MANKLSGEPRGWWPLAKEGKGVKEQAISYVQNCGRVGMMRTDLNMGFTTVMTTRGLVE